MVENKNGGNQKEKSELKKTVVDEEKITKSEEIKPKAKKHEGK